MRVVAAARLFIGLSYRHHHIPLFNPSTQLTGKPDEDMGLDCSNFTSFVYNFAGIQHFTSDVQKQAHGILAPGRLLDSSETLEPGDLVFFFNRKHREIGHVAIIYSVQDENQPVIIDSSTTNDGVSEHVMTPSQVQRWAWTRRIIS
jgi:cell wall-associated NlpC family hydrolase